MKYEWIKQKSSKLILAGCLLLAELIFLYGVFAEKESTYVLGIISLAVVSMIGMVIVGIEAVITYYQDMKEKRGYMLFMTPNGMYSILAAKLLVGFFTVVLWAVLIFLLAFADVSLLVTRIAGVQELMNMIQAMVDDLFAMEISWGQAAFSVLFIIAEWATAVTAAFLAVTVSMTLLTRIKWKGLISFLLYVAICLATSFIYNSLLSILGVKTASEASQAMETAGEVISVSVSFDFSGIALLALAVNLTVSLLCFHGAGTLLKKRLSL